MLRLFYAPIGKWSLSHLHENLTNILQPTDKTNVTSIAQLHI